MSHVIVKLWPGKSEQQKIRLAEAIAKDIMDILHCGEESVSVAIDEVEPQDWAEKVCKPDIPGNSDKLYKKLGYSPIDQGWIYPQPKVDRCIKIENCKLVAKDEFLNQSLVNHAACWPIMQARYIFNIGA